MPELDGEETDTGIDLGLASYAVLRGRKIASPKFFRRQEKKLKRAQRKLSRCQKGSNNRRKAKLTVAKIHARIADKRRDFIEQETTRITRESQAVYLEDLNVKGMANGRFGKSLHDQSLGISPAPWRPSAPGTGGPSSRWTGSSPPRSCAPGCGALTGPKGRERLRIRTWRCECGSAHDRDQNAEYNLRLEGRSIVAAGRAGHVKRLWSPCKTRQAGRWVRKQEPPRRPPLNNGGQAGISPLQPGETSRSRTHL